MDIMLQNRIHQLIRRKGFKVVQTAANKDGYVKAYGKGNIIAEWTYYNFVIRDKKKKRILFDVHNFNVSLSNLDFMAIVSGINKYC